MCFVKCLLCSSNLLLKNLCYYSMCGTSRRNCVCVIFRKFNLIMFSCVGSIRADVFDSFLNYCMEAMFIILLVSFFPLYLTLFVYVSFDHDLVNKLLLLLLLLLLLFLIAVLLFAVNLLQILNFFLYKYYAQHKMKS